MAKGDKSKVQNSIDYQGGNAQNWLNNTRNAMIPQNQDLQNRAQVAYDQGNKDYANITGNYNQQLSRSPISYSPYNQTFGAYPEYQQFAQTGGFSPEDIAAMRARAEGSVRSIADSANRNIEQENRIMGGSSPARTAALSKIARQTEQQVGNTDIDLEAQLADSIRQGKLAGMQGMTGIDTSKMQEGLQNAGQGLNAQGMEANRIGNLLSGMTNAYSATPGQANMYGNLLDKSNGQMINMQQLQQQLSDMIMRGQLGATGVPGDFSQAMGNIGSVFNLGSKFFGLPTMFGSGSGGSLYGTGSGSTPYGYIGG